MANQYLQFSHLEKVATLTHLYLELRLPLAGALRAAKADLQMDSLPDATQRVLKQHACLGSAGPTSPRAALGLSSEHFFKSYLRKIFSKIYSLTKIYDNVHCHLKNNDRYLI